MPQPTKPQLAIYAAFAIAVLLIGARFLRESGGADAGTAGGAAVSGAPGDGASGAAGDGASGAAGTPPLGEAGAGGAAPSDGSLVVDVKGAVRRQGVYRLPAGARVLDAVRRAGGVTGRADRLRVNLAARVVDGGEVVVPRRGEPGSGSLPASGPAAAGGGSGAGGSSGGSAATNGAGAAPLAIDINTASAQELEQLDGVGPATAAKIVAYRELNGGFRSIDELDEVSGIGEAKMAAIRAQLGQ